MPYFDHNATTPLTEAARARWLQVQAEAWQNPSSLHRAGAKAKGLLETLREQLAAYLAVAPAELVFTSGATEGVNAIAAHWAHALPPGARILVNPTEHPCVLAACRGWLGDRVEWLPVSTAGVVDVAWVRERLARGDVGAVVVMAANNETGVLQPWAEVARLAGAAGAESLCDASQWLGKLPADGFGQVGWVIASAHKFGGPKAVGFLKRAGSAKAFRGFLGGHQEGDHRAGTEDVAGIAAMLTAFGEAESGQVFLETQRTLWRDAFERTLRARLPGVSVVGAEVDRLWNTVALVLPHGEGHRWVARLDQRGFQVSTGSACASGQKGPSHVLAALGVAPEAAARLVRISAGWSTTEADWLALAEAFVAVAPSLAPDPAVVTL